MNVRISIFFTPKPDIVGYSDDKRNDETVSSIEGFNCAESVFQVISPSWIKENTIKFEPEREIC